MKRKIKRLAVVLLPGLLFMGCAAATSPVTGGIFTDVKSTYGATSNSGASKQGRATCTSILGAIAAGNCSIGAAMQDGGISKVQRVDYETTSILGIYATHTVIVSGE